MPVRIGEPELYDIEPKWKEECGVYGVYSRTEDVSTLTYLGLYALQHRGQESAGIALTDGAWMDVTRGMGLVNEVFRHQLPHMEHEYIAIGHVRYSTTGSSLMCNTQPLLVNYADGRIALAHNGNLTNAAAIRHKLEQQGTIFRFGGLREPHRAQPCGDHRAEDHREPEANQGCLLPDHHD